MVSRVPGQGIVLGVVPEFTFLRMVTGCNDMSYLAGLLIFHSPYNHIGYLYYQEHSEHLVNTMSDECGGHAARAWSVVGDSPRFVCYQDGHHPLQQQPRPPLLVKGAVLLSLRITARWWRR